MGNALLVVIEDNAASDIDSFLKRNVWNSLSAARRVDIMKTIGRMPSFLVGEDDDKNELLRVLELLFFAEASLSNNRRPTMFIDMFARDVVEKLIADIDHNEADALLAFLEANLGKEAFMLYA